MTHRRPDPRQAGLERALKHALRLAVDSVEPGADGLDRIRARIAARPSLVRTGWQTTYLAGLLGVLSTVWRFAEPAAVWLRYWSGAAAERFRPDLRRAGWLGWLRPAAALATGLLVVTGASWAIAALPQVISNADNSQNVGGSGSSSSTPASGHHRSQAGGGTGSSAPWRSPSPQRSHSCRPTSPAPGASGSPTQPSSPSPSASSSPSPSPSPSTSSSTTPTGSPSPSGSPSGSPTTNSPAPAQASQSAQAARALQVAAFEAGRAHVASHAGRTIDPLSPFLTPKTVATPTPGASRGRSPCS